MGDIASGLGQMASGAGRATGLSNLASGVADLFTGGGQTPVMGQPGASPSPNFIGPPAPGPTGAIGQELVGPPSPVESPGFLKGFAQGFVGMEPGKGADVPMGAGGEIGGGLGQLFHAIEQLRSGGASGAVGQPIVDIVGKKLAGVEMAPGYQQATRPEGGLIHKIIAAYTGGIIS
jgi:hypothetical protein